MVHAKSVVHSKDFISDFNISFECENLSLTLHIVPGTQKREEVAVKLHAERRLFAYTLCTQQYWATTWTIFQTNRLNSDSDWNIFEFIDRSCCDFFWFWILYEFFKKKLFFYIDLMRCKYPSSLSYKHVVYKKREEEYLISISKILHYVCAW